MKRLIAIICLCLLSFSCAEPETRSDKTFGYSESGTENLLPSGAYDFVELSNGWWIFKLKIDGSEKTFLWRYYGYGNATTEILTQIK